MAKYGFGRKISEGKNLTKKPQPSRISSSHQNLYDKYVAPLAQADNLEAAEHILLLLSQSKTPLPEIYRDLAQLERQRNRHIQAKHFQKIWLELETSNEDLLWQQASEAQSLNLDQIALDRLNKLLMLNPHHTQALEQTALQHLHAEKWADALALLERRIDIQPCKVLYYALCSFAALEQFQLIIAASLAQHCFDNICLDTNDALDYEDSSLALGISLAVLSRLDQDKGLETQALEHAKEALKLARNHWPIERILIKVYLFQHKLAEASYCIETAIEHEPNSTILHLQRAELLWHKGFLWQGFIEYEWRNKLPQSHGDSRKNFLPGHNAFQDNERISLYCDGRLGDTFLFLRYACWMKEQAGLAPILFVQRPALTLLRSNLSPDIPVEDFQEFKFNSKGRCIPLLSAPALFGTPQEHPGLKRSFLKADPAILDYWLQLIQLKPGEHLIGINWHGSALHALSERHVSDIPLRFFAPIAELPNVRLISLQRGTGSHELKDCIFFNKFVACQPAISKEIRLEHIAALISLCDLIVTDDSGPAHLAGCLGIKSLVLLPERCNWRWASLSSESSWYPSAKLLRCQSGQNWQMLIEQASQLIASNLSLNHA